MRKIIPIRNTVLCEKVDDINSIVNNTNALVVNKTSIPTYKIVDYSVEDKSSFIFENGDIIITASKGDEVDVDGKTMYLFMTDHVVAKII